jgi:hypothetical protein
MALNRSPMLRRFAVAVGAFATGSSRQQVPSHVPPKPTTIVSALDVRLGPYPEVRLRGQREFSELSRAFQFDVPSSNLCAEGLSQTASANHATVCFAAASAASREEYTLPE